MTIYNLYTNVFTSENDVTIASITTLRLFCVYKDVCTYIRVCVCMYVNMFL